MNSPFRPGEWVGFYKYHDKPQVLPMHLTLQFQEGVIKGSGVDRIGAFLIQGAYDQTSGQFSWRKRYPDKQGHGIPFEGQVENGDLKGNWTLSQMENGPVSLHGSFHIWFLPEEKYPGAMPLSDILKKEIAEKTAVVV